MVGVGGVKKLEIFCGRHKWITPYLMMSFFIFVIQINPKYVTYILERLQGHSFPGNQFSSFALKELSVSESFISICKGSQIFGAKNETDSVPCLILSLLFVPFRKLLPHKLLLQPPTKTSLKIGGERPCKNLYVSAARFLTCIVTELSLSSKVWKDDGLPL